MHGITTYTDQLKANETQIELVKNEDWKLRNSSMYTYKFQAYNLVQ